MGQWWSRDRGPSRAGSLQTETLPVMVLWSNPGEKVLTPFMGVGSEVYGAVRAGRKGIGIELKPSYYRQAAKNVEAAALAKPGDQIELLAPEEPEGKEQEAAPEESAVEA